jgi:hypothetical protein
VKKYLIYARSPEAHETIAYRFAQQGIPAVSAIERSGRRLFIIENTGYLIYPWVEGYTLDQNKVSEYHALKMAEMIANLHTINMNVPEIKSPHVDIHPHDRIADAIGQYHLNVLLQKP